MFLSLICRHQTVGKTDCNAVGFCSVTGCHVTCCIVYFGQFTGSTAWFRLKDKLKLELQRAPPLDTSADCA
jgi:hypothetical protein